MGLSLDSADAVELFEFERAQVGLAMKDRSNLSSSTPTTISAFRLPARVEVGVCSWERLSLDKRLGESPRISKGYRLASTHH
jgi:hypothetical protein